MDTNQFCWNCYGSGKVKVDRQLVDCWSCVCNADQTFWGSISLILNGELKGKVLVNDGKEFYTVDNDKIIEENLLSNMRVRMLGALTKFK